MGKNQESEGSQKSQGAGGNKEDGGRSLFLNQIIDFAPAHFAPAPAQPVFNCTLHRTVALDSGSEARYVRRQGRGLGI